MNLLGFLAIVIAVTGLIWLLQMIFNGKDRIDINLSVGRRNTGRLDPSKTPTTEPSLSQPDLKESDSILGEVVTITKRKPEPTSSPKDAPLADTESQSKTSTTTPPATTENPDAYLDTALEDETFEDQTNDSLLKEVSPGQLNPPIGQLTYSGFGSIAQQFPVNSFENPQSAEQIEAMFEVLREGTRRIEQQMIALYEVHRSILAGQNESSSQNSPDLQRSAADESGEYSFGDEDEPTETSFGGGLDAQLATVYSEDESQNAPVTEYITMEELGIPLPDDACQTYDASEVLEPVPEVSKEILPYLASLNKTGELSYEVVEAIKKKAPTREVKHRVRQVLRAIDHFDLSGDANAALRVTAVFSQLPEQLGEYDNDVAAIGRKFGLIQPEEEAEPLEVEEASVN